MREPSFREGRQPPSTVLIAILTLIVLSGCQVPDESYELTPVAGELSENLTLPSLSGDRENVVAQMCGWAAAHQIPYGPDVIDDVYIDQVASQDASVAAWNLLYGFANLNGEPRRLTIFLDPSAVARPESRGPLYDLVQHAGVWTFEKVEPRSCSVSRPGFAAFETNNRALCIQTSSGRSADRSATIAAYHNVAYRMSQGPLAARQLIDIEVLTLMRAGALVGRSVRVTFAANPLVLGGFTTVCEPRVSPLAFESTSGDSP